MPEADTPPYIVAAVGMVPQCVFDNGTFDREVLNDNLTSCTEEATRVVGEHGARLIVFPQFGLTGHAMVPAQEWHQAAIDVQGREIDAIADVARRTGSFIVVQVPERHPAFPDRYFLSCVVVGPDNGVVLVHRKSYSLSLRTSPVDVHDRFLEVFGRDAFHPVIDTAIGRLGATIGAELHWPEACRSLALKGAEVIVNPIAAVPHLDYLQRYGAQHVRSVRAFENMTYITTANMATTGAPPSAVYDFKGAQIEEAVPAAPSIALATIDLAALRAWRAQPSANFLAQIQASTDIRPSPELHWPANHWPDKAPESFDELIGVEADSWRALRHQWSR